MACISETEIALMKGVSTMLDENTVLTLGYFIHTEKRNRAKSEYLYLGRIDTVENLKAEIADMTTDEKKLDKWIWNGLPNYKSVCYDKFNDNAHGYKWISTRLKKAVSWEKFCMILDGWKETKQKYNANAKYASVDYVAEDGTVIHDLKTAKELLVSKAGQFIKHRILLKCQRPKDVATTEPIEEAN